MQRVSAGFAERDGSVPATDAAVLERTRAAYGANLAPITAREADTDTPLFHFPHALWGSARDDYAAKVPTDPHRGWTLEFTDPADGGSVMRTISAFATRVAGGTVTRPRR